MPLSMAGVPEHVVVPDPPPPLGEGDPQGTVAVGVATQVQFQCFYTVLLFFGHPSVSTLDGVFLFFSLRLSRSLMIDSLTKLLRPTLSHVSPPLPASQESLLLTSATVELGMLGHLK